MATKTRLNKVLRTNLKNIADRNIEDPEAGEAMRKAKAEAHAVIVRRMGEQWPKADMDVLAKYNCMSTYHHVDCLLVANNTLRYFAWEFDPADNTTWVARPAGPYGQQKLRVEAADDVEIVQAFFSAEAAFHKARREKIDAFHLLIDHASYLEQIEEVWPEAKKVRPFNPGYGLPVVQVSVLLDKVREIVEADAEAKRIKAEENAG